MLQNKSKKMQGRKFAFLFLEMAHVSKNNTNKTTDIEI